MLFSTPWWIYLALIGVVFSAYMIVRTSKEERQVEESYIEKEGEIFIERMNTEREAKKSKVKQVEPM